MLPLFHALAQMANLLLPLSIGARVVFLETVNTTELLRALKERGVTIFACVPQFFYLIHQRVTAEVGEARARCRGGYSGLAGRSQRPAPAGRHQRRAAVVFGRVHDVLGRRMRVMVTGGSEFDPGIGARPVRPGVQHPAGLRPDGDLRRGDADAIRATTHLETVGPPLPGVEIRIRARGEAGDDDRAADGEDADPRRRS